ncbi:MAG: hypothetical protein R3228_13310 [Halioglobus sp.]|nr:hypothetical protein [Halioglobus sp.]
MTGKPLFLRRLVKALLYTPMTLFDALRIPFFRAQPKIEFTVEADPPSVYYNFRVRPDRLDDFARYLDLPANLPLCPIRCVAGEEPDYQLTVNVYRVSGISNGVRAELSTYVEDEHGIPRYMVVEARDHDGSMDPINIITRPSRVEQSRDTTAMTTVIESDQGALFRARAEQALFEQAPLVDIHGEWMQANDFIYWRNGVRDRCYYDAGMANPRVRALDPAAVELTDDTHWAQFLEPEPRHVLVYETPMHFIIVPWENL